jgi:hypothetical protein
LVAASPKNAKLLVLPEELVNQLRAITIRKGVSLTNFAAEALEQAIRMEAIGGKLEDAIDIFNLYTVSQAAGVVHVPRTNFNAMIAELYKADREGLLDVWREAGRWYGEYMRAMLGEEAIAYFRDSLLVSWNLDEVNITRDGLLVTIKFVSFVMSLELTELLNSYILGVMSFLGYELMEEDGLRGLTTLRFREEL